MNRKIIGEAIYIRVSDRKIKSDSHETWKCVDPELEWQIRCFSYGERSDVPRLQQVEQKSVGQQRNLGLGRDQKYSSSGDCKRNVNYGTRIKYPNLEQCQSCFSLFKFFINVSTFLISWIKSLFFSKQRHTSVSVQTDWCYCLYWLLIMFISSMDWLYLISAVKILNFFIKINLITFLTALPAQRNFDRGGNLSGLLSGHFPVPEVCRYIVRAGSFKTAQFWFCFITLLYDLLLLFVQRIGMLALFNLGIKTLDLSFGSSLFRRYAEARPPTHCTRWVLLHWEAHQHQQFC